MGALVKLPQPITMTMNYKTKDLYLAAVLKTLGYKVESVETRPDTNARFFTFGGDKDKIEEDVSRFWNNELNVYAKELYDSVQLLKDWLRTTQ